MNWCWRNFIEFILHLDSLLIWALFDEEFTFQMFKIKQSFESCEDVNLLQCKKDKWFNTTILQFKSSALKFASTFSEQNNIQV